ncbi:MAG: phosphoribosylformylglycinamidine cyclo-ligase [Mariprofundaceae bacterium]|nr:phosphoribosylformylglycinamidine cyclo-ligase [Mariprofundaceae bacterium]
MSDKSSIDYAACGVDIDAGNDFVQRIKSAVKTTTRPEVISGLGGFGGLFAPQFSHMEEPVLVSATDGVGTKLLLLQEHQRPKVAGQDVVAMCVNDIAAQGAQPLFFLDYLACGGLDAKTMAEVVEGVAAACKTCECALIGGETAEMPGMYAPNHYDIAGFSVGAIDRKRIVDGSTVKAGDVILGLASNGVHSNGYSMVRKLLELGEVDVANASFDDGTAIIDELLAPTRLYVPAVNHLVGENIEVHAYSHITGGGMYDNLERLLPESCTAHVDIQSWPVPRIFDYLLQFADVPKAEQYRTFNMGIGFCVILAEEHVAKATSLLEQSGEKVFAIGRIETRKDKSVVLQGLET